MQTFSSVNSSGFNKHHMCSSNNISTTESKYYYVVHEQNWQHYMYVHINA